MSRPDRIHRRRLALVAAAFLLGFVASPAAAAQTEEQADVDQFGGFIASARSNGIQVTYDSPGLLPTGSPIIQVSVPEALATLNSGPVGYALSSFAYPGPLIADLGSALEASGTDSGIPPYPVRSQAFYPSGPTNETNGEEGIEMTAITEFADSRALASYSGFDVNPAGSVGNMVSNGQSVVEGDQLVTRSRSVVTDVSLMAGLVKIDSVVTDLVATSNGTDAASAGGTTVSGATVLGRPATIGHDGIRFDDPPESDEGDSGDGSGDDPTGGALDGALEPVTEGLGEGSDPLNDLLDQVGGARDDALQQLFDQSGIEIKVLAANETVEGGSATRSAGGVSVTYHYDGANTPVLTDLLALIPSDDLPAENLGPIPFSPQAVAKLFEKQHIQGFAIAPANVSANATPSFEFEAPEFQAALPSGTSAPGTSSGGGGAGGGFESATPELPAPPSGTISAIPSGTDTPFPFGDAIPALLVFGVILGSPFLAAGTSRLADNTLAAVGNSCPDGLDLPPQETGS